MALPIIVTPGMRRRPGNSALELPYLYTFDNETVGQPAAGWLDHPPSGWTPIATPTIVNSPVDSVSYNPGRKCLYFNTDATNFASSIFALPGLVDVSAGIRVAFWFKGEVQAQIDTVFGFFADGAPPNPGANGFEFHPTNVGGHQCDFYGYVDGVHVGAPTDVGTGSSIDHRQWMFCYIEWNPVTGNFSGAVKRCTNNWHLLTIDFSPSWAATLAASWSQIGTFRARDYKQANVYMRDMWLLGFWIGRPTDNWPNYKMPLPT